jgi:transcriptional regulator with XRE-family HTH domain
MRTTLVQVLRTPRRRFGLPAEAHANADPSRVASELVRAVRGRRSQEAFSKRLGYNSNVLYLWESGRRYPSASRFLQVCERAGIDVARALAEFLRSEPPWLARHRAERAVASTATIANLLSELRGQRSIVDVAKTTGKTRFRVARWFAGETEPRLPDFLSMIEATSFRLVDFIAELVDPQALSSLQERHHRLQAARQAVFDTPWCHVILRLLETRRIQDKHAVTAGDLASELGLSTSQVEHSLRLLETTQQVEPTARGWTVRQVENVDTATDPAAVRELKAWAARIGLERLERGAEGLYSYNLFCVSRADYDKLQALHRAYFRQVRALVAESTPSEDVVMMNLQLFRLSKGEG